MYKYGLELLLWTGRFTMENLPLISKAKQLGFDGVEIHIADPAMLPVQEIKNELEKNGMGVNFILILNEETNSLSKDPQVRKNALEFIKRCIDRAYEITGGGCYIAGVSYGAAGYITGTARTSEEWDWAVHNFRAAARYAQGKDIILAAEVLNRFETHFLNTAFDAVRFCKDVGEPNVRVHLDTYHMIREEKSFYEAIVNTGEYLGYFHACENDRGIPGTGLVQWEEVYRGLMDIGYQGWIMIESFVPDIKELARIAAIWRTLAPSADDLAKMGLKNLKQIEKKISG
jgi:D-psicose/D-tagatose/L-ribulose 3-epimerase